MKKSFLSIILVIAITAFDTIPVLSAEFTSGYDVEESILVICQEKFKIVFDMFF